MPTVNNQNPYARGARAAYVERQVNASNNRRHSTGSNDAQGQVNQAFDWSEITKNRKNALPRENSIRRVSSAPELPTTTVTTAETQPRNATADRLKKAGFAIASLAMITQLTGIIASIAIAALGFAVVPFIVPLIVVTIVVAFIGAAVIALGCYKASQEVQPPEGAASTQIEDANIQQAETHIDDDSDSDIDGAGASPQIEFILDRPAMPQFPNNYTLEQKIEDYITGVSKTHYKDLNADLMRRQSTAMDAMRNMTLPTADGSTERVNMFRYIDTFPNLNHVVSVGGNINALVSDLNSPGFPDLGYATQFPRFAQIGDLLEVMVQENISLVNPISQLKDIKKHKLYPYWLPENSGIHRTSNGKVYQLESKQIEDTNLDYQAGSGKHLYLLTISWIDGNGQQQQYQLRVLHIDSWQDHGAVGPTELQGYVQARLDNEGPVKGKILTHCTAGVGRTGTLIAAQSIMEHPNTPLIDVVDVMRERRNHACVQSNSQAQLLAALDASLRAQRGDTGQPKAEASDIEPVIVPSRAPRMRPVLPPYGQDGDDSGDQLPTLPPKKPRQPIVQPEPSDSSAQDPQRLPIVQPGPSDSSAHDPQWLPIVQPGPSDSSAKDPQRVPKRASYKPQFDGQQATSRHQQLKAKIEAALGDHPGFNNLQLMPEGVDGRTAVKALPPGDKRVLVWPSNSYPNRFAYGIMSSTGEPRYYIMNNDASPGKIRLYMSQLLDR